MSDSIQLSEDQHDIYLEVVMWAKTNSEATLEICEIEGSVSELHIVAFFALEDELSGSYLTTTLPAISNQIYLFLTDTFPGQFYKIVAQFDADSESNDSLKPGHLTTLTDDNLIQRGWYGIAILPISAAFEQFPDKSVLNGDSFEFSLLVFLTKEEYNIAMRHGVAPLIAYFNQHNRPLNITNPYNYPSTATKASLKAILNRKSSSSTTGVLKKSAAKSNKPRHYLDEDVSETYLESKNSTTMSAKNRVHRFWQRINRWAQDTGSEKENLENYVEFVIGLVAIFCGLAVGLVMLKYTVPGAIAFPIFFCLVGAFSVYTAIKTINQ